MKLELTPIGFIDSVYKEKFGTPRQSGLIAEGYAKLTLLPQWQPEQAFDGIQGYSHLWLIWWFHKNSNKRYHAKVHPPRLGGQTQGVFSTRSPHRPNPLGLSLVELVKVEGATLWLKGVDLVDGTPIFDIKPYLVQFEALSQAKSGWSNQLERESAQMVQVIWDNKALNQLKNLTSQSNPVFQIEDLKNLIDKMISQDPRPLAYKAEQKLVGNAEDFYDDSGDHSRDDSRDDRHDDRHDWHHDHRHDDTQKVHVFRVDNFDVFFKFTSPRAAEITSIVSVNSRAIL